MSGTNEYLYGRFDGPVREMGFYIIDIDMIPHSKSFDLVFYADKPGSAINLDECAEISRLISEALDEDAEFESLSGGSAYTLQVSSPGLDKKLDTARELKYFRGRRVEIRLKKQVNKSYKIVGKLEGIEESAPDVVSVIYITPDGETETGIPWSDIKFIKLYFEI